MLPKNHKVIIELFGLPGSGKSTLLNNLKNQFPSIETIRPTSKGRGILRFFLRYPTLTLSWLIIVTSSSIFSGHWSLLRYRLSVLLSTYEAMGQALVSEREVIILDEGLLQRALALYEEPRSAQQFLKLLKYYPREVSGIVLVNKNKNYFGRYEDTNHPRRRVGEKYFDHYKSTLVKHHSDIVSALEKTDIQVYRYDESDDYSDLYKQLVSS